MNNKRIGEEIQGYRREKKLTQRALGKAVGRSEATIRKYEKGDIEIPLSVLEDLAEVLEVHPTQLLGWEGEYEPAPRKKAVTVYVVVVEEE